MDAKWKLKFKIRNLDEKVTTWRYEKEKKFLQAEGNIVIRDQSENIEIYSDKIMLNKWRGQLNLNATIMGAIATITILQPQLALRWTINYL